MGININQTQGMEKHYISRNNISNAQIGITDGLYRGTGNCTDGDVTITHNQMSGYLPATTTAIENLHKGIQIGENSPSDDCSSTGTLRIDSNNISGFATGIYISSTMYNFYGRMGLTKVNIDHNTIVLKTNSTVLRQGIDIYAMKYVEAINKNLIYGDVTQGVTFKYTVYCYCRRAVEWL